MVSHQTFVFLFGIRNTLSQKRPTPAFTTRRKNPRPHTLFTSDTLPHILDFNPTFFAKAQSRPDWPK